MTILVSRERDPHAIRDRDFGGRGDASQAKEGPTSIIPPWMATVMVGTIGRRFFALSEKHLTPRKAGVLESEKN